MLIVEFVCSQTVALIWTGPDKGLQTFLLKILEELVKTYDNYKKSCILGECVKNICAVDSLSFNIYALLVSS